ncbi:uncharacterized protein LOC128866408 [Anastrepha ludens]|uniref:uncharacterized protein LOC128866408 n=1 Tax=Anastrepha ludens TaxID=28586 RepID=UPI0023AFBE6F|nr:uncharacterized protein LOC128866408 [Anastrepha ludens]
MSEDSMDGHLSSSSSSPEKRRSTVPDILPHQRSFEKRYSHMIHKQILETGVNKEALQRQINAYFSCGSASGGSERANSNAGEEDVNENVQEADKGEGQRRGNSEQVEESKRSLDKAETFDIADVHGAKAAADL